MKRFSSYFFKPDDYFTQSHNECTPLGRFVICTVVTTPIVLLPAMAISHLATQAFENGDTTNLVEVRSRECNNRTNVSALDDLKAAQDYADTHGGPSSVCYIEGSTADGRTWYTVGS